MFAKTYSAQPTILGAKIISVEVDLSKGLHSFTVVGLPDKAVEEARDRVGAAIKNCGLQSPKQKNQKIVVSLAPADIKKEGPIFDLPIAISYLIASGELKINTDKKIFIGELSLDGSVQPIRGVLPVAREARDSGFLEIFVPKDNAKEASLIGGISVFAIDSLEDIIGHFKKNDEQELLEPEPRTIIEFNEPQNSVDISDIRGQSNAKRALEIAAAGGHNIALYGPPGTGKTMLAKAFISLLPPLSFEEMLEATSIHSVAGTLRDALITHPPLRSPHHTASHVSMIGGGTIPKPGEVTLAHRGVLFLDEFPEFERRVIDSLRQPLEDRIISISRARGAAQFPAHFILIAALNPCPCGYWQTRIKDCTCSPVNIAKYQRKISGPIMDRIDMWTEVSNISFNELGQAPTGETSGDLRIKVAKARDKQKERFEKIGLNINLNSAISAKHIDKAIPLSLEVKTDLNDAATKLHLSPRAYHKVIKLGRTIADLHDHEKVEKSDIHEAIRYRPKQNDGNN